MLKLPKMTPHTAAKHLLLKRYLDRWFPILGRHHRTINYIDGFAGPGEYQGGEVGSPQIAIEAARSHVEEGTLDPDALRLWIRAKLRRVIQSIWMIVYDTEDHVRHVWAQVCFHDGSARRIVAAYSTTNRPSVGDARLLVPEGVTDLRAFRHVYPNGIIDWARPAAV